jgi:hypothetical protein
LPQCSCPFQSRLRSKTFHSGAFSGFKNSGLPEELPHTVFPAYIPRCSKHRGMSHRLHLKLCT